MQNQWARVAVMVIESWVGCWKEYMERRAEFDFVEAIFCVSNLELNVIETPDRKN